MKYSSSRTPSSRCSVASATGGRQSSVALNGHKREHEGCQDGAERDPVTIPVAFEPERAFTGPFGSDSAVVIIHPTCAWFVPSADCSSFFSFLFFPFLQIFFFQPQDLRQRGVRLQKRFFFLAGIFATHDKLICT